MSGSFGEHPAAPVVATAEALVATGDLAIIRDDSLRRAIPAYLGQTRATQRGADLYLENYVSAFEDVSSRLDILESMLAPIPPATMDSLIIVGHPWGLAAGARTIPFPIDVEDVLQDRITYSYIFRLWISDASMRFHLSEMRRDSERLLGYVERARGGAPQD